ncbi:hypothetical protein VTK26DRAFT_6076 [Humicola hyalothermophila]
MLRRRSSYRASGRPGRYVDCDRLSNAALKTLHQQGAVFRVPTLLLAWRTLDPGADIRPASPRVPTASSGAK